MKKVLLLMGLLGVVTLILHAGWQMQQSPTTARLRGISVLDSGVVWASGSNGTYMRTTDGGKTWDSGILPGAEKLDFRDVQAVDANTAYLLSIGPGEASRIYKTRDGGRHWALQFIGHNPKAFFDAFAFWDASHGIALSDPVEGHFRLITTSDGGKTWNEIPGKNLPPSLPGEGAFAASGTCIAVQGEKNAWFATGGGAEARVFRSTDGGLSWKVSVTPVRSGASSAGIFSIAFRDGLHGVAVGGDYKKEQEGDHNIAITADGGRSWAAVERSQPRGYRSAVAYVPGMDPPVWIAVGPSGSDISGDDGSTWAPLDASGYDALCFAPFRSIGWASGEHGRVARFDGKTH